MDFRRDSTKQPSLRFQTLSKMCLLKWIHLNFSLMLKKQLLDFFYRLNCLFPLISSWENAVLWLKFSKMPTAKTSAQIVIIEINCKQLNAGSSNERYQGILIIDIISSQACNNT